MIPIPIPLGPKNYDVLATGKIGFEFCFSSVARVGVMTKVVKVDNSRSQVGCIMENKR